MAADLVESGLRAERWVEGPEPSPVLWFDVESPVAGSAFATPAAPTMVAKAPRLSAPAASHTGAAP